MKSINAVLPFSFSFLAAIGMILPMSLRGMQELRFTPSSENTDSAQLSPERTFSAVEDTRLPPVPQASDTGNGIGSDSELPEDEAMLRGPVHEAFAEQFNEDPVPGMIVPRQPPELIEELPPDVRPDGRQVEWVSGYWAWDDDEQDFFWVSGIWREVPQGFRWLPGYWAEADAGYQWVPGTWVSEQTEEMQYVETPPPESLELGPVGMAPSNDHIWIPGCWIWNTTNYAWRPGYWSVGYSNWMWMPARNLWTPRGYLHCNGYWDYPLNRRGMLFAPHRFRRGAGWNRGRSFTPQIVIATNLLQWNLWVRPRYRHYYFGDYYGARYAGVGYQPWHRFNQQRRQFDPLYSHFNRNRSVGNNSFYNQINGRFDLLTNNVAQRPVRAFNHRDMHGISRNPGNGSVSAVLGSTLQQHVKDASTTRFVKLKDDQRNRQQVDSRSLRQLVDKRREVEHQPGLKLSPQRRELGDVNVRNLNLEHRGPERGGSLPAKDVSAGGGLDSNRRSAQSRADKIQPQKDGSLNNRLRLPPVARREKDQIAPTASESASNPRAQESRPPGTPATRGDQPRGVSEILNRARNSAQSDSKPKTSQNGNTLGELRPDTAGRVRRSEIKPVEGTKGKAPSEKGPTQLRKDTSDRNTRQDPGVKSSPLSPPNKRPESIPSDALNRDDRGGSRKAADSAQGLKSKAGSPIQDAPSRPSAQPQSKSRTRVEREARPPAQKAVNETRSRQTPAKSSESPRTTPRASQPSKSPAAEKPGRSQAAPATKPPKSSGDSGGRNGGRRKK